MELSSLTSNLLISHCSLLVHRSQAVEAPANLSSIDWSKLKILLEWLQNKKKITDSHLLLADTYRHMSL